MFVGGCSSVMGAMKQVKGAELNCDLDYTISLLSWKLSRKYPHLVEIATFRGYYLNIVKISKFRGYYPHFMDIYVFRG